MPRPRKKARILTYRDLREAAAFSLTLVAVLGTLSLGAGLFAAPVALASALGLVLAAAGLSAWLRGLADMDSAGTEWIARARPALLLSGLGGTALFLGTLLMVPLSGWSAWLALALPLLWAILVRSAFLVTEADYAILSGLSLVSALWLLSFPGWGPRALFWGTALLALAILVSGRLWNRHRQGVLKGKVSWGEWLPLFGVPAAGMTLLLALAFLAAPPLDPLWNPERRRPSGTVPRIVVEWNEAPSRPGKGPAQGASGPGNGGSETPAAAPSEAGSPDAVVIRPPSGGNLVALVRSAFSFLSARGLQTGLGLLIALPLVWLVRRLLRMKRSLAGAAEGKLKEILDAARRRRREKAPPPPVPEDPRDAVVHLYNDLRAELDRHGYKKQPHLAPWEYAKYLAFRIDDQRQPIEQATRLFEAALYARSAIVGTERREMMAICERLRRRVQTGGVSQAPAA